MQPQLQHTTRGRGPAAGPARCRRKFLEYFPKGFRDPDYLELERNYKVATHRRWQEELGESQFVELLDARRFEEIAARAVRVEQRSQHSMIFSFEKMALRDAVVRSSEGAELFANGLYDWLHGPGANRRASSAGSTSSRRSRAARHVSPRGR